jgi:hypothetical protein
LLVYVRPLLIFQAFTRFFHVRKMSNNQKLQMLKKMRFPERETDSILEEDIQAFLI